MKKILAILLLAGTVSKAQDTLLRARNGEVILPQKGDWGLSIDATRFIKDFQFNFAAGASNIMFKYFKDAHTAYRLGARIGLNEWTTKSMTPDRVAASGSVIAYPAAEQMKQNIWKRTSVVVGLSAGIEKRRGAGRLQGIYGLEGGVYLTNVRDKFTYGNALNASPLSPIVVSSSGDNITSPQLGAANNIDTVPAVQGVIGYGRLVQRSSGLGFAIGGRAFVGVEYFFLPKMSVGGEFGWGVGVAMSGRTETIIETIGQSNIQGNTEPSVKKTTIDGDRSSTLRIDNDNASTIGGMSASLRLNLYF